MTPFEEGRAALSILDNPYYREYPRPSAKGPEDETAARRFVDGYVFKFYRPLPRRGKLPE